MSKADAKILKDAAKYIRKHGWQQGAYGGVFGGPIFGGHGPACLLGAITSVGHENRDTTAALDFVIDAEFAFAMWNDAKGRTKEDVIAALETAAYIAESL